MIDSTFDSTVTASSQPSDQPWEDLERWNTLQREIKRNTFPNDYTQKWLPIAKNLALILGHRSFRFCFLKARLACLTRDTAVIEFESRFKRDHVRDFYMPETRRAIRAAHPWITVIGLKVAPGAAFAGDEIFYTRKDPDQLATTHSTTGITLS
jgi:hypothetical protein